METPLSLGAETALKVAYLRGVNFYMILVCGMYYIRISTIITYDKQLAGRSDRLQLLNASSCL